MINHRRWERVAVKLAVTIFDGSGAKIAEATSTDVCESGLGLNSPVGLQVGLTYGFMIASISGSPFKGLVRWSTSNARDALWAVGVEFAGESREQIDAMRTAVARWRQAVAQSLTPS